MGEKILANEPLKSSTNSYDWLGHGTYFWESNPQRGLEFAKELVDHGRGSSKVETPFVIGAIIDLGFCLDLATASGIEQVKAAYSALNEFIKISNAKMPENHRGGLRRDLDCAVIQLLHEIRKGNGEPAFDTVKGIFLEGEPIYPTSGFYKKSIFRFACAIQIASKAYSAFTAFS